MNRRSFLKRLGGAAAAISLSPLLDLAEIVEAPSVLFCDHYAYTIIGVYNLTVDNPRRLGVISAIA